MDRAFSAQIPPNRFPGPLAQAGAPPRRTSHRMKESNCRTMEQQEARSNCVTVRWGGEQPSARNVVGNASELDSARQVGEPASHGRSQALPQGSDPRRSHHMAMIGRGSLSGVWRSKAIPSDVRGRREIPAETDALCRFIRPKARWVMGGNLAGTVREVRASVGAKKRGNARGAKGRRKVEAGRP